MVKLLSISVNTTVSLAPRSFSHLKSKTCQSRTVCSVRNLFFYNTVSKCYYYFFLQKRSTDNAEVEVYSVKVDCKVASRFAHTVITSSALNKANSSQEVFFEVDLPKTAFITNFSMEIEGQTYTGEVKEKEKAKKQYQKAVSTGQTAGLVKASGRKMEKFTVSVNIAANSNVTFILTHEELLQRKLGQYEIMTRVKPKQLVQHFEIVADIYEPQGIAFLEAYGTFISNELLPLVEKTVSDKKAHISFCPTLDQQRKCLGCEGTLIDGDFFIKYDVNRAETIGDIQIVNGYFVHFFAPSDLPRVPKNVVFVIDRSGSMRGIKMKQTKDAMLAILNDLAEDDYFGIVLFDSSISTWKESLTKATKENVSEAQQFIQGITDLGTTNINDAVMKAVDMIMKGKRDKKVPERSVSMVILMTDGMPNSGESSVPQIQENVLLAMGGNMTLFCLGFGDDVDYSFLDVMSRQNKGLARRIYEGSDATVQLQGFYEEVASPLLSEVDLRYPDNLVNSLTTSHYKQLFNGSEIVVAGRLTDYSLDNFLVEVFAHGFEEDFIVKGQASAQEWDILYPEQEYIFGDYTERLWAYLTIQELLSKRETGTAEEKGNATAQALEMSLQYSFVTPLTSMVVTKPETDEEPEGPLIADKLTEDERQKAQRFGHFVPQLMSNAWTHSRISPTNFVDGDPHFMIELPEQEDALCFNIDDRPGTIFNLVRDQLAGILVNGQTIGDKKVAPDGKVNTYFGRFGIIHQGLGVRLEVTTHDITVSQDGKQAKLFWSDTTSLKGANMDLQVTKDRSLTVTLRDSVRFVVILHKVWKQHPYHQDYLGFYTLDSHLLSPSVHGLLGQFYHGVQFEVKDMRPGEVPEKPDATMLVKGQELTVTRGWQRDFRWDVKNGENIPCWFIHSNGNGLIDGNHTDYIMSGLFKTV
ncbi:inter-alpha-trypsin inhibitor heavy chain H3-like isoform X1 [Oncorhynchus kisutch]|uniref:Inter-alpha-trypsin inhibitor heavy chain H3 n=1 Tax=Oncorhynchus kisutch TaxID=8019 RepID=A0A8C7GE17_ONCKI|nr:inter-alpha-trypsin inhibitor heavy chain H3-like isoform X1 [Oncorhynchus kisutch]